MKRNDNEIPKTMKTSRTVFFIAVSGDPDQAEGWTTYGETDAEAVKTLRDYLKTQMKYRKNGLTWVRSQVQTPTDKEKNLPAFTQIQ